MKHLGRNPESEKTLSTYMAVESEAKIAWILTRSPEYFQNRFRNIKFDSSASNKLLIIGNCQAAVIGKLLEAMSVDTSVVTVGLESSNYDGILSGNLDLSSYMEECNNVVIHNIHASFIEKLSKTYPDFLEKRITIPAISYTAFHPDMGYINREDGTHFGGPTGDYQSLIAFWAWQNALSSDEALSLYRYDVYEFLGYFEQKTTSDQFLIGLGKSMGIAMEPLITKWAARGCFMHSINHPKLYVLADVARLLLDRAGISYTPNVENYLTDDLAMLQSWDIYPEVASKLGLPGSYTFKRHRHQGTESRPVPILTLKEFVERSYAAFESGKHLNLRPLVDREPFKALAAYLDKKKTSDASSESGEKRHVNPYAKLKGYQFWRRGIEAPKPIDVDPVVSSAMHLTPSSKVATAGSCFAQHISRTLSNNGFTYFVAEAGDASVGDKEDLEKLNYGVYSARYGNLYTSRQLVQLFDRAYGKFSPLDSAWLRKDGRYVDPFRPMINPDGHATEDEVKEARLEHFKHVRNMFENLDVFVFTLGLTESWRRREDGAIFPLAPGVAAGGMDHALYEFVNFETHDVVADLQYFLGQLAQVNPAAKVIFTVSPVPLVATYEDRHVLTSTTYSKSALRSAADYIVRRYAQAEYFPSYEIITGNYNKGAYFETDLRSVREEGVSHVMRLFMEHYSSESTPKAANDKPRDELDAELLRAAEKNNSVVCEEEALDPGSN
jgi:hypothetical protein